MSSGLQPFLISEFKTGINTYLQPWMRPADAFEPLVNCYINRGAVNKRNGFSQYGRVVPDRNPIMGIMQYLDQSNGETSLVVATTENLYLYDPGAQVYNLVANPPVFTGDITNFFNWTNWQAFTGEKSYLWMVNNIDAVTNFDGTTADQPDLVINGLGDKIVSALDVKVYKQRLLLIRPTLSAGGIQNQSIYWCKQQNPLSVDSWRVDVAGNGGNLDAPTGDSIVSAEFIRDVLVVFFTNSTWIFRYTGNDTAPFRWDKVNDSKSTNAPYGSIDYDQRCTAIGSTGLIACDGVNVQRYDVPIVDYYETNFSIQFYAQAFGERYDNLNQGWMLYVSADSIEEEFPKVGGVAPGSNQALIYNFFENSFATYTFPVPMTCLGLFFSQGSITWSSLTQPWEDTDMAWNSYTTQFGAPILLSGDTSGHVWYMDDSEEVTDKIGYNDELIATGDGGTTYSGTLLHLPVAPGSFEGQYGGQISPPIPSVETFIDTPSDTTPGVGELSGSAGGTGTINYVTGEWTFTFNAAVPGATPITANYNTTFSISIDLQTTRWNPIMSAGQKVQFPYIDIYYAAVSDDPENPIDVTLNFFGNNNDSNYLVQKNFTLDAPAGQDFAWKRVYVNLIGEFFQMEIDPNKDSFMQFLGFVIWAKPAGRLTP